MKDKQAYDKPRLRKVRLEVKTSVLADCNTSIVSQPSNYPVTGTCKYNQCYNSNLP